MSKKDKVNTYKMHKISHITEYAYQDKKLYTSDYDLDFSNLKPITPNYIPEHHDKYVEILLNSINDPDIKNVALQGELGSGKSSIIKGLEKRIRDNSIKVSLSTLKSSESNLEYIQQEIVNQIVFNKNKINLIRKILPTIGLATIIFLIILALDLPDKLKSQFAWQQNENWYLITTIIFSLILGFAFSLLSGSLGIKSFEISGITLENSSENPISKNIETIIQHTKRNRVKLFIFEDLDRLKNPEIFDQLRSLNRILNNSLDFKVTFIYATKRLISEEVNGQQKEVTAENWVKFFDFIIPVLPFSSIHTTHEIHRELGKGIISEDSAFINIFSNYINDFRLLQQIYNEYYILKNIFHLAIQEDEVELYLSAICYKLIFNEDFNMMIEGNGNLDKLDRVIKNAVFKEDYIENHTGYSWVSKYRNFVLEFEEAVSWSNKKISSISVKLLYELLDNGLINKDYRKYFFPQYDYKNFEDKNILIYKNHIKLGNFENFFLHYLSDSEIQLILEDSAPGSNLYKNIYIIKHLYSIDANRVHKEKLIQTFKKNLKPEIVNTILETKSHNRQWIKKFIQDLVYASPIIFLHFIYSSNQNENYNFLNCFDNGKTDKIFKKAKEEYFDHNDYFFDDKRMIEKIKSTILLFEEIKEELEITAGEQGSDCNTEGLDSIIKNLELFSDEINMEMIN